MGAVAANISIIDRYKIKELNILYDV